MADELKRNYDAFRAKLPELLATRRGKFALMHDGEIVDFYDSIADAYRAGLKQWPAGAFSVQEVTDISADLGFFSHAVPGR